MKNKIILLLLITFLSCSNPEEEICNCRENSYERTYDNYTIVQCDDYL